ncbi:type VI secretion protein [Klebsiella pneumoniae]|nr:type VI secretion protein [Klebsiella pneumoniae]
MRPMTAGRRSFAPPLWGCTGVDSPLPTAYLDDIAQHREGHEALQGLLDIFSHRIMTQFYRIWRKYSWPATFEPGGTDRLSQSLLGLAGLGIPGTTQHIASPASALSGANRRAASARQNPAGDPGAGHPAGPGDHRQGEPVQPASGGRSASRWGFYGDERLLPGRQYAAG